MTPIEAWVFILMLNIPSWCGVEAPTRCEIKVPIEAPSERACKTARKVVTGQLRDNSVRHEITPEEGCTKR